MKSGSVLEKNIQESCGQAEQGTHGQDTYKKSEELFFGRDEVSSVTILHGGLPQVIDKCFSAALQGIGYRSQFLPVPDNDALEIGREYCDSGLCNPTYYTVGNLVKHLDSLQAKGETPEEIVKNYVFLTGGSCGPCRFGMYESQYRLALEGAGYKGFRVLVFNVERMPEGDHREPGLKFDLEFVTSIVQSIFFGDQINELRYLVEPYEVKKGATHEAVQKATEILTNYLRNNLNWNKTSFPVFPSYFKGGVIEDIYRYLKFHYSKSLKEALLECRKLFEEIEVEYTAVKPLVQVTGEFWAQATEGDGNYKLYEYLAQEGAEVRHVIVANFMFYILFNEKVKYDFTPLSLSGKNRRGILHGVRYTLKALYKRGMFWLIYQLVRKVAAGHYQRISKFLGNRNAYPDRIQELAEHAKSYIDVRYEGGEAFMEVGKNIDCTKNKKAHMVVSVKPFGCMPSTVSDAIQAKVVSEFDDMTFLPLETSGDGKINALSRVQMTLGEARQKAAEEFKRALAEYSITHEQFLELHQKYKIRYHGAQNLPWVKGYTLRSSHYLHQLMKKAKIQKKGGAFV